MGLPGVGVIHYFIRIKNQVEDDNHCSVFKPASNFTVNKKTFPLEPN